VTLRCGDYDEAPALQGWWRMALLVLYFSPDHLRDPQNFAAVANKLICSPVTQVLVFTKVSHSMLPSASCSQQAQPFLSDVAS
jgi:hypothetical protein